MGPFFEWLRELPVSVWISQSDSLLAYPAVLFLHSVGMGLSAGIAFVISLRLLGVARGIPLPSLRVLFPMFWGGFYLNLFTGSLLFAAAATSTGYNPMYYLKLFLIAVGLALFVSIRRFVSGSAPDTQVPARVATMAAISIVIWFGVIIAGRMIAYLQF
jgi:hypothetical protein